MLAFSNINNEEDEKKGRIFNYWCIEASILKKGATK
jgi:hypothetical protein